jgi:hypothetical protein
MAACKAHAKNVVAQTHRVPEPQASLLTGILLSDDSGIPKSVQDAFHMMGNPTSLQSAAKYKTKRDVALLTGTLTAEVGSAALRNGYCR